MQQLKKKIGKEIFEGKLLQVPYFTKHTMCLIEHVIFNALLGLRSNRKLIEKKKRFRAYIYTSLARI